MAPGYLSEEAVPCERASQPRQYRGLQQGGRPAAWSEHDAPVLVNAGAAEGGGAAVLLDGGLGPATWRKGEQ